MRTVQEIVGRPGRLYAWGANHLGQAGDGPGPDVLEPRQIKGLPLIVQACCNGNGAIALDEEGGVWGWGWDVGGSLGPGLAKKRGGRVSLMGGSAEPAMPSAAPSFSDHFSESSPGSLSNCAWPRRLAHLPPIRQIALGAENGFALDRAGGVWSWGGPACIGRHETIGRQDGAIERVRASLPAPTDARWPALVQELPAIQSVVCDPAGLVAYAVDRDGQLWSWGLGLEGELGRGSVRMDVVPGPLQLPAAVRSVHPGKASCLALLTDGTVWGWGSCASEFGFAPSEPEGPSAWKPVRIIGLPSAASLWVGGDLALLRTPQGQTFSFGRGSRWLAPERVGDHVSPERRPGAPLPQSALDKFIHFTLGRYHGFGVSAAGEVIGFGRGDNGALGTGRFAPQQAIGPTWLQMQTVPIAAAAHHSLGLL